MSRIALLILLIVFAVPAWAYIGPGAGVSFVGALWSFLVGIVLVVGAILAWPLRVLWRKLRKKSPPNDSAG